MQRGPFVSDAIILSLFDTPELQIRIWLSERVKYAREWERGVLLAAFFFHEPIYLRTFCVINSRISYTTFTNYALYFTSTINDFDLPADFK